MICFECSEEKCSGACGNSINLRNITDYKTYKNYIERKNDILERYLDLSCNTNLDNIRHKLLNPKVFTKFIITENFDEKIEILEVFEELNNLLETKIV